MAGNTLPSWYKNNTVGATLLSSVQNSLLPYMTGSSGIAAASNLSTGDPTFLSYQPSILPPPSIFPSTNRKIYLTRERAERALAAVNRIKALSGDTTSDTAGLKYLQNTLTTMRDANTNGGAMTRKQYLQMRNSINSLKDSSSATDAEGYATLANYISGEDDLMPYTKTNGRYVFGQSNRKLFG